MTIPPTPRSYDEARRALKEQIAEDTCDGCGERCMDLTPVMVDADVCEYLCDSCYDDRDDH